MKVNVAKKIYTHEGAPAVQVDYFNQLKRSVLSCMLFEDNAYENGVKIVDRIKELCSKCKRHQVFELALQCSEKYQLRHVPLQMIVEALKIKEKMGRISTCESNYICSIITRPDMITDLLALYWADGKKPLAHQLKKGLAMAFTKFDEYQLAKYNRDNPIKLRDILFLCHAKPKDEAQAALWKRLVNKQLKTADTWETRLSSGADKKQSFLELLQEKKLGKLALLRNLRNIKDAGISKDLVASELMRNNKPMFPFQYLAAARECPEWEDIIDPAMIASCALKPKMEGKTIVLVDVSGSMDQPLSSKSKMSYLDAACGLTILIRECVTSESLYFTFSEKIVQVAPRRGMALRDIIHTSQMHNGTYLGQSIAVIQNKFPDYDRLIIITDEQSHDAIPNVDPKKKNYILNVANNQNGVGKKHQWLTISGFAEASIDFIREYEEISLN